MGGFDGCVSGSDSISAEYPRQDGNALMNDRSVIHEHMDNGWIILWSDAVLHITIVFM